VVPDGTYDDLRDAARQVLEERLHAWNDWEVGGQEDTSTLLIHSMQAIYGGYGMCFRVGSQQFRCCIDSVRQGCEVFGMSLFLGDEHVPREIFQKLQKHIHGATYLSHDIVPGRRTLDTADVKLRAATSKGSLTVHFYNQHNGITATKLA
jgi:hypothetical protein